MAPRQRGPGGDAGRFDELFDQLVGRARVDAGRVAAEAQRRGLAPFGPAPIHQVESLRRHPATALDPLAASFIRSSSAAAGAQGFVVGLGGLVTLPLALGADAVATLYWVVRATSGVMSSYGFETETPLGTAQLRLGLLAATGIDEMAVGGRRMVVAEASRALLTNPASPRMLAAATKAVIRHVGVGATRGRLSRAVPVIGGAVGGAASAAMVQAVGRRARRHFRALLVEAQQAQARGLTPGTLPVPLPPPPGELGAGG